MAKKQPEGKSLAKSDTTPVKLVTPDPQRREFETGEEEEVELRDDMKDDDMEEVVDLNNYISNEKDYDIIQSPEIKELEKVNEDPKVERKGSKDFSIVSENQTPTPEKLRHSKLEVEEHK